MLTPPCFSFWLACAVLGSSFVRLAADEAAPRQAPSLQSTRPVSSADMDVLNRWSEKLGKDLIRQTLDIDVDSLMRVDLFAGYRRALMDPLGGTAEIQPAGGLARQQALESISSPDNPYNFEIRLEQNGDALRLRSDLRDIPLAFQVKSKARLAGDLMEISTSLYIPLSWKDEFRAGSSIYFPGFDIPVFSRLLRAGGFDSPWTASTYYSNRLGVSVFTAGVNIPFRRDWNLFYHYHVDYQENDLGYNIGIKTDF